MTSTAIRVAAGVCRDFERSSRLEWLATNGTGGYAMGTVAGANTRRYHGLLVASLKPLVERSVLLSRVEEEALIEFSSGRDVFPLGACQYPGVVTPRGFEWLDEFRTDPCPAWRYRLGPNGPMIEKQVYMIAGQQAVVIRYRADRPLSLRVRPFLAYRDYHSLGHSRPDLYGGLPHLDFYHTGAFHEDPHWYFNVEYLRELDRGFDFREDLFSPGTILLDLEADQWSSIVAGFETGAANAAVSGQQVPEPDSTGDLRGGKRFVVRRSDGRPTIIAGYPWFTDWGRDTMISLPGLLIAPGRLDDAREVIQGFLDHIDQGIIPNRFPDSGETPEYNTADATLWMFQAARAWLAMLAKDPANVSTMNRAFLRDRFYPAAKEIIGWHRSGTWHGIVVDPSDRLLKAGTADTPVTWMDAKVDGRAVTPRIGKAVELNALWYGALCLIAEWAAELKDLPAAAEYRAEARLVRGSFRAKFWNADRQCLFDVLTDHGADPALRPNQIFAVSLPHPLLEPNEQQGVVRIVERELLTPVGLRTLERSDPAYRPRYEGSASQRDGAYHQGTVWPWLLGPFIDAYLIAFGKTPETLSRCRALVEGLETRAAGEGCIDSISEIYDGEEPRRANGCPAQAWSVAEIARVRAQYGWT